MGNGDNIAEIQLANKMGRTVFFLLLLWLPPGSSLSTTAALVLGGGCCNRSPHLGQCQLVVPTRRMNYQSPCRMIPDDFQHISSLLFTDVQGALHEIEHQLEHQLTESIESGASLSQQMHQIPEQQTSLVLESIGFDLLIFLAASVLVTPISKALKVSPILGYLVAGAILGPHALDVFANSMAAVELGDFGILFLLFSEGLDVSRDRLKKLSNYLPLGLAQIALVTLVIMTAILSGVPKLVNLVLPLDPSIVSITSPVTASVLGMAAALSTSAFIFPVLKEREWENEPSGQASTSILLLQDLMVAPLLVILPFMAAGTTDWASLGALALKATVGFGGVLYLGSFLLRSLFTLVAQAQSTETFVALCLWVALGMGVIAKALGLTDTAGAFAAGVLLANTNYRAQIQADILPFKGILLGIFFMVAGSTFDLELIISQFPSIFTGTVALLFVKAATLGLATRAPEWMEPNRLSTAEAIRVSLLLAGGGEFAFVVLTMAQKLNIVPTTVASILSSVVLITMALTPMIGEFAAKVSKPFVDEEVNRAALSNIPDRPMKQPVANDAIVVCGYGEIGQKLVSVLESERDALLQYGDIEQTNSSPGFPNIVAFELDPALLVQPRRPGYDTIVLYGNGANGEVIRSSGITSPTAIFVCYEHFHMSEAAVTRLRASFPSTPVFTRTTTNIEAQKLRVLGATEVIVESDELSKAASNLLRGAYCIPDYNNEGIDEICFEQIAETGLSQVELDQLREVYRSMDQDGTGQVSMDEVKFILEKSGNDFIVSDTEIDELEQYLQLTLATIQEPIQFSDLCRLYIEAPAFVKKSFGLQLTENNGAAAAPVPVAIEEPVIQ